MNSVGPSLLLGVLSTALVACSQGPGASTASPPGAGSGTGSAAVPTGPGPVVAPPAAAAATRPNIIVVVTDDQRADSLRCMPKLAELLRGGTTFASHYATTPLCCPARTSILTGRYPHNHGVQSNGDKEDGDEDAVVGAVDFMTNGNPDLVVARWLRDAGYRTAFVGKYLNGYDEVLAKDPTYVPPHWDDWYAMKSSEYYDFQVVERARGAATPTRTCYLGDQAGKGKVAKAQRAACKAGATKTVATGENYSTHVLGERATALVREAAAAEQPFFLYLAPKAPHLPADPPRAHLDPAGPHGFAQAAIDRLGPGCDLFDWTPPPSFKEADVSDKPPWVGKVAEKNKRADFDATRRKQLVAMVALEDELAKVLGALGDDDRETVVIFVGDNGLAWGEHWYGKKNCMYEECAHVPLVIRDPRATGPATVTHLTQDVDLAPTIAELAGVTVPYAVDGKSLAGYLRGAQAVPTRDRVLLESWSLAKPTLPGIEAAVRTPGWKYIEHYEDRARTKLKSRKGAPEVELYDLTADPHELENLARTRPRDAKVVAKITELAASLRALRGAGVASRDVPAAPPATVPVGPVRDLTFVPGSTIRLDQSVGDDDQATGGQTRNRTRALFGVRGTDLGSPMVVGGKVYFLFGDTLVTQGQPKGDMIGVTSVTDPEANPTQPWLGFVQRGGKLAPFSPDGTALAAWSVPVAGVEVHGEAFVTYKRGDKSHADVDETFLARFDPATGDVKTLSKTPISKRAGGQFINLAFATGGEAGGAAPQATAPWVYAWGLGEHRASEPRLLRVRPDKLAAWDVEYLVGGVGGPPQWASGAANEAKAPALFEDGTMGDLSVTWVAAARRWLMIYDHKDAGEKGRKVLARTAPAPWGPWTEPQTLFDPTAAAPGGFDVFIHDPDGSKALGGPVTGQNDPQTTKGGVYAPYVIEPWTRVVGGNVRIYYILSTWNPYVVFLMRSDLALTPE